MRAKRPGALRAAAGWRTSLAGSEGRMSGLVTILAAAGVFALALRIGRAAMRSALRIAEVTAAKGLVEISLRRGDLTGVAERRTAEQSARRGRRREMAVGAVWGLWLIAPLFTPWTQEIYAVAAPLWLLPRSSARAVVRR
jgi:hypothetical protein